MKRYELKFKEGKEGVLKVSLVKDAAINTTLVHFAAEKEAVQCFTDEEKKVIYSVVMRPNIDIFRRNVNGEPADVHPFDDRLLTATDEQRIDIVPLG